MTKSAVSKKPESSPSGGVGLLSSAKEKYDLTLLPGERFEGRDVYVIACRPKEGVEQAIADLDRMILYIDKETGFQIRTAAYLKKKKKPMTEMVFSDLKVNPRIDPKQFVYTPPEDVEVVDETVEAEKS